MITRIVKMTFKSENCSDFLKIFEANKNAIAGFENCLSVELLNDIQHPNIFFTYSKWKSEEDLNRYRESELFRTVWSQVKPLFEAKTEAWSVKSMN